MHIDTSNATQIKHEDTYYIIEEYQSAYKKWRPLIDKFYLPEYEFGQNSACGQCWQETGQHGMYDLEYAKAYCNKLNESLKNGELRDNGCKVTQFRICEVVRTYKKTVLMPDKY